MTIILVHRCFLFSLFIRKFIHLCANSKKSAFTYVHSKYANMHKCGILSEGGGCEAIELSPPRPLSFPPPWRGAGVGQKNLVEKSGRHPYERTEINSVIQRSWSSNYHPNVIYGNCFVVYHFLGLKLKILERF